MHMKLCKKLDLIELLQQKLYRNFIGTLSNSLEARKTVWYWKIETSIP